MGPCFNFMGMQMLGEINMGKSQGVLHIFVDGLSKAVRGRGQDRQVSGRDVRRRAVRVQGRRQRRQPQDVQPAELQEGAQVRLLARE